MCRQSAKHSLRLRPQALVALYRAATSLSSRFICVCVHCSAMRTCNVLLLLFSNILPMSARFARRIVAPYLSRVDLRAGEGIVVGPHFVDWTWALMFVGCLGVVP